jgi:hypothetical protein
MTTRINLLPTEINTFEKVRRAELEALTGCPIHHVIEGTCREPGCKNAALQFQKEFVLSEEACLRLREVTLDEGGSRLLAGHITQLVNEAPPLLEQRLPPSYARGAAPIFQTKPRLRCVL